jgi:hypothetical protein
MGRRGRRKKGDVEVNKEQESKFAPAPEVEEVANEVIKSSQQSLRNAKILYLFRSGAWKEKGRYMWGECRLVTGMGKVILEILADEWGLITATDLRELLPQYVVTINKDGWDEMNDETKQALVDHELSHAFINEDGRPAILPHDYEDFLGVVNRHGAWNDVLIRLEKILDGKRKGKEDEKPAAENAEFEL